MSSKKNSIFRRIKDLHVSEVLACARKYLKARKCMSNHKCHLTFLHRCLERKILSKSLRIKSPVPSYEGKELARCTDFNFIKLKIHYWHKRIKECSIQKDNLLKTLSRSLSEDELNTKITKNPNERVCVLRNCWNMKRCRHP